MEESSRRPSSTVRVSRTEDANSRCDDYIAIHSRLENNSADSISITYDHLFALFTTLAGDVHRDIMDRGESSFEQLANNDVGIVDAATTHIGEGGSFSVRSFTLSSPSTSIVLKSVLPVRDFTDREEQARLGAIILELRALSHQPLRNHRNIVKLLGLGWETDWEDPTRKWPVLIQECAYGTLDDLLEREPDLSYQHRLKLSLGISEGLLAIQCCGIAHGDLKPANVLIYPVTQRSISECRWIPKLSDFGGSVLDIPEGATARLPMRSVPWQAPEWADYLTRDGLLRTDLYSLGLTIWSIMANGASPKLHLADTSTEGSKSHSHMASADRTLHVYDDCILHAYLKVGEKLFNADIDRNQVEYILAVTLRVDPLQRDLKTACDLLRSLVQDNHETIIATIEPSDIDLKTYTPVTRMSQVENLLMLPDMLYTLSPVIQDYMRKRLAGVFEASKAAVKSSAAFTLAVDALRHTEKPDSEHQCMIWLIRSAENGNKTARSLVYRFSKSLNYPLPPKIRQNLEEWLIDAAQRNYPAAQQDMHEILSAETCQVVWGRFRSRYSGMGWNRFAPYYENRDMDLGDFDKKLRNKLVLAREQPNFNASSLSLDDGGDTILHFAASAGFEEVVRLWRAPMPVTVDAGGTDSETPLLLACRSGHGNVARLLLEMGADPKIQSSNGDTPLHWVVAFRGDEAHDIARALVDAGADVDAVAKPIRFEFAPLCNYAAGTPLHRAVGKGNVDAVRALLACGASAANAGGEGGTTPISLAAHFHYAKILDTLLESLNDPLAATYPHAGGSLLAIAISGDVSYGEKFSKIARHGQSWWQEAHDTFDVIRRWGGDKHMRGFTGETRCAGTTPLLLACAYNLPETVQYLLDNGCRQDINAISPYWVDGGRNTPLVRSMFQRSKGVFKLLLDNGADATQIHVDDWHDLPPLYICAAAGHDDAYFAERLFTRGASIDGFDDPERLLETPFACALRSRCFGLAKWLLDHGANPHREYQKGLMIEMDHVSSVLGFLVMEQTTSSLVCIDFLLRQVPDVSFIVSSKSQYSVLHALAMRKQGVMEGSSNRATALVFQAVFTHFKPSVEQINQKDVNGRTAVWMAVATGNCYVTEQLLEGGADPRIKDAQGDNAIDINNVLLESSGGFVNADFDPRPIETQAGQRRKMRHVLDKLLEPYKL